MNTPRLFLSPPYMGGKEQAYIQEAFDTNWIAPLGPNVAAFEQEVATYVGRKHALATNAGTAAMHLALRYLGVGQGDTVFCTDLTFSGSCNPILYEKAQPVFIDSEPGTYNMSPAALEDALVWAKRAGKLPKAVIIVDLYGQSADYDALLPLCAQYGVPVIEDAAEALGATYGARRCGAFGDIAIFSFNGNKIVNSSGGGMIVSDHDPAIQKMLFWATQAREPELHYEHKEFGYNYRLSNICAGIGRGQMEILDWRVQRRKEIFEAYSTLLQGCPVSMYPISPKGTPNYWLSVILLDEDISISPHAVCAALDAHNIESRPAWKPMHMQPVFKDCPYFRHQGHDVGEDLFRRGVCLPSGEAITAAQQEQVAESIKGVL